jgi:hypothetical protein
VGSPYTQEPAKKTHRSAEGPRFGYRSVPIEGTWNFVGRGRIDGGRPGSRHAATVQSLPGSSNWLAPQLARSRLYSPNCFQRAPVQINQKNKNETQGSIQFEEPALAPSRCVEGNRGLDASGYGGLSTPVKNGSITAVVGRGQGSTRAPLVR